MADYIAVMFRLLNALFLSLTLVLTSYSMAAARGQSPDRGMDMVICTGVGMTTITIGADGKPVETTHICPDAMSIFATTAAQPNVLAPPTVMQWRVTFDHAPITRRAETLCPSARGPPLDV